MNKSLKSKLVKYFLRVAALDEMEALVRYLEKYSDDNDFKTYVRINYLIDVNMIDFNTEKEKKTVFQKIKNNQREIRKRNIFSVLKYAAVLIVGFGLIYWFQDFPLLDKEKETANTELQIQPGKDKAILTLEDQTEVVLEQGTQLKAAGISLKGKQLVYDTTVASNKLQFNYLTIPRGGQFFVQLSDGTKVWLNSESQLKYPVHFIKGQTRRVELHYGEAYFEVSPSSLHKGDAFKVKTGTQQIDVLGTAFNIKAYKNEKEITSTLVEGKIRLSTGKKVKFLQPSEQLTYHTEDQNISIHKVDKLFDVIAWKEGYFSFKQKSMKEIMETLSRWYDMSYVFKNPEKQEKRFTGVLDRESHIGEILKYLQMTNEIKFTIYEKTVTIE